MFRRLPFQQQEVANADHGQVLLTEIGRTVLFDRQGREALLSHIARLSYDILLAYLQTQVTRHGCYSSCPGCGQHAGHASNKPNRPQMPSLLLKAAFGLFEMINMSSVPKFSFVTRSISTRTHVPSIRIMRLIPCFQLIVRDFHQSMGDLASLQCQLLVSNGIFAEVRQNPYPNDVVGEAEQKSLPRR